MPLRNARQVVVGALLAVFGCVTAASALDISGSYEGSVMCEYTDSTGTTKVAEVDNGVGFGFSQQGASVQLLYGVRPFTGFADVDPNNARRGTIVMFECDGRPSTADMVGTIVRFHAVTNEATGAATLRGISVAALGSDGSGFVSVCRWRLRRISLGQAGGDACVPFCRDFSQP